MSISDAMNQMQVDQEKTSRDWGGRYYDGDCPNCGRNRLMLCANKMHRCEKCNWSPELGNYAPIPVV